MVAAPVYEFHVNVVQGLWRVSGIASDAKLSQMMVNMRVYDHGPLVRLQRTEVRMSVLCVVGGTLAHEAVDRCDELGAFES